MKKIFATSLILLFIHFCNAQKYASAKWWVGSTDVKKISDNFPWFSEGYATYIPDSFYVHQLAKISSAYNLLIFAGIWCDDTRKLIPACYKVTDLAGLSRNNIELYLLNERKKSPRRLERNYNIKAIPVIIIFKEGKEIGRIIENTEISLEADLLKILN